MSIAAIILAAVATFVVGLAALYLFAPRVLFEQVRQALRRKGGLTRRSVRAGGFDWPFLEGGDAGGPPLVLVHGFGGDKDNWSLYAPFVRRGYRLIFPDLPGFGDNDRSLDADHSIGAQAARLAAFLDALGIEKCHLGGNSMGGAIALRFALDCPQRLLSLTLFNNAGVLGTEASELQQMVERGETPLVVRTFADIDRLLAFIAYNPRFIPVGFKRVIFADMKRHEALLDKIFNQIVEEMLERPYNDRLAELSVPTQIIWGRHDRLIDVSCAYVQNQAIVGSELVILEDVGHVPMIEQPAETARHHLGFLAKQ